ncbi:MAG TPA: hypothetical protein ENL10_01370 [Candidatus Cloacimonetes bacterium]|nr:hypothetical protein [Candidatus Cloacimonadota bacterium]
MKIIKLTLLILMTLVLITGCSLNFIKKRLPSPHKVKGGYIFQFDAPSARTVTLSGSFPDNMWSGTATASGTFDEQIDLMYDDGTHGDRVAGDGIWTVIKQLAPGRYEYKFVIDRNTWVKDPNAFEVTDDGYGGYNSVLIVD